MMVCGVESKCGRCKIGNWTGLSQQFNSINLEPEKNSKPINTNKFLFYTACNFAATKNNTQLKIHNTPLIRHAAV